MQGFPYILLEEDWCEKLRKQTLALAERAHHYFEGAITNFSIRSWQKKYIQYLEEQQRLPFPLFRLADDWHDYFQGKDFIRFQSARGEGFQLPLTFSEDLAYLLGVVMGDGHLADYFVNIIDSSKEHIENLARLLDKYFHSKLELFEQQNANAWNVNILGKWIVRFFNFLSSQPINERKYPYLCQPIITRNAPLLNNAFWRGIMDADGSYKTDMAFTTASKQLSLDLIDYLSKNHIACIYLEKDWNGNLSYFIRITGKERKKFSDLIGSNHPQKKIELVELLRKTTPEKTIARKEHSDWTGKIIGYRKDRIVNGYFNFNLLKNIHVVNAGLLIKNIRKDTKTLLEKKFSLPNGSISKYENNVVSIPLSILDSLIKYYKIDDVMLLLEKDNLYTFSNRKSKIKLPLKVSSEFSEILEGLQVKNNYFLIIGIQNMTTDEYKKMIQKYFQIPISSSKRFNNSVLSLFVNTFCIVKD
ncbi:MAG: hypothetical protein JXA54_13615 [Candidatus Heimdallarchaeota archaeon]|nr:hypothetical protein [Candidatus Heimdallarchaeota archaeon]